MKLLFCLFLICTITAQDFSSKDYQALYAMEKQTILWNFINLDQQSSEWPESNLIDMLSDKQELTFQENGDTLPEGRQKIIHSVGVVAKAKFTPVKGNPYTGILKSGSNEVLIRLSTAKDPKPVDPKPAGALHRFIPGIALKFLIDGRPSTNLVAMHSSSGQSSWNFFKHEFSTSFDIPYHNVSFAEKLQNSKFCMLNNFISTISTRELCSITNYGKEVEDVKHPFKLIFKAPEDVQIRGNEWFYQDYIKSVTKFKEGTELFEVYAVEEPECEKVLVGHIVLTSKFTTSKFGDERLFFKHVSPNEDFKEYPEWAEYRDYWGVFKRKRGKEVKVERECPFKKLIYLE
jgi:hypothetical protein